MKNHVCESCKEESNYPQDEFIYLNEDDQEIFYQDAIDYGYAKAVCHDCYKEKLVIRNVNKGGSKL